VEKRCGKCREDLPESAFNRAGDGRQHWCRECFRTYFRNRGALHLAQARASREARKSVLQSHVLSHLASHPCVDCGEADLRVLEFDHVGEKDSDVAALVSAGVRLGRLIREMSRCEIVCSNCHRRRTATRGRWWRGTPRAPAPPSARPRQARNAAWVYARLSECRCIDCGVADAVLLDFDHVGSKRAGVMVLAWSEYSIETLMREIAQCEVRCCNCHRRRTSDAKGWFRSLAASSEPS